MITIELIPYDAVSNQEAPAKVRRSKSYSMLDGGGIAVLVMLLLLFITPMVLFATSEDASARIGSGFELRTLLWSAVLAVVLPLFQIFMHIRRFGGPMIRGNREGYPAMSGVTGRIAHAHTNLIESLLPFAIVVIAAQLLHVSNGWTIAASSLYLAARMIHAFTYMMGITVIRSSAFYAGTIASFVILYQLPLI